jgi:hypothetical protein
MEESKKLSPSALQVTQFHASSSHGCCMGGPFHLPPSSMGFLQPKRLFSFLRVGYVCVPSTVFLPLFPTMCFPLRVPPICFFISLLPFVVLFITCLPMCSPNDVSSWITLQTLCHAPPSKRKNICFSSYVYTPSFNPLHPILCYTLCVRFYASSPL